MKQAIEYKNSHLCPKGASISDIMMLFQLAEETGLSVIRGELRLLVGYEKEGDRLITPYCGIGAIRKIIRTDKTFGGIDEALYDGLTLSDWRERYQTERLYPNVCSITMWRIVDGSRSMIKDTVAFREYAPDNMTGVWKDRPFLMISKCAESFVSRKGWPELLNGLYIREEFDKSYCEDMTKTKAVKRQISKTNKGLDYLEKKIKR